jgi:hypothetical protein
MKILFQNVRKGVIGGESSATWGVSYFGLPYCCGDFAKDNAGVRHLVDSSHPLNLVDLILSKLQE